MPLLIECTYQFIKTQLIMYYKQNVIGLYLVFKGRKEAEKDAYKKIEKILKI